MLINSGSYLIALLLTIAIEVIVAIFFGFRKKSEIATIIFINLITNPLLNYLLFINGYLGVSTINITTIIFLEVLVVLVEWLLLRFTLQQNPNKLFTLSLVMNFCSYIAGVLIFR
ncbi:MAG: hypothetical protein ACPLW7_00175 [Minisyncoccia bacterium]